MPPSDRPNPPTAERSQPPFTVPSAPGTRYLRFLVRETHLPIGDDYVIDLDPGGRAFLVDGKLLRVRESLTIKNVDGDEVLHVQGTFLEVRNALTVSRHGVQITTVRKQMAEPDHVEYTVELPETESVEVIGDPAKRKYKLSYRGAIVATITRTRLPFSSGFRVQIPPGQDDEVVLAVTVCLDVMSRR